MESDGRDSALGERYALKLWVRQGEPCQYFEEHWFVDAPEREIIVMMFEEAKRTFRAVYPDEEPNDFAINVERLRPADDYRPNFRRLIDEQLARD